MSSFHIKEESDERLHLTFEPTLMTWALASGALSFIIGYPLYSYDSIGLILLIWILGTTGLLAFFNPWQDVIFDKEKHTLVVNRQNFYQHYNLASSTPVKYELEKIVAMNYESPNLIFTLTNYGTFDLNIKGDSDQTSELVDKIQNFLQLDVQTAQADTAVSDVGGVQSEAANEDSSSATSDDSFERIDTADLAEYENSKVGSENDIPSDVVETLSPSPEEPKEFIPPEAEERLADIVEPVEVPADDPTPEFADDGDDPASPSSPGDV